jgi:LysM repeat protein
LRPFFSVLLACLALAASAISLIACGSGNDDSGSGAYVTATMPDPLPTAYILGAVTPLPQNGGGGPTTHTVAAGESPSSIAAQYGITAEELMAANGITDPASLTVGQQLTIPGSGVLGSTATPPAGETPQVSSGPNANGECTYTVAPGDVADSIASGAGTTVEELAALNNTSVDDLRSLSVGDTLVVPCA